MRTFGVVYQQFGVISLAKIDVIYASFAKKAGTLCVCFVAALFWNAYSRSLKKALKCFFLACDEGPVILKQQLRKCHWSDVTGYKAESVSH